MLQIGSGGRFIPSMHRRPLMSSGMVFHPTSCWYAGSSTYLAAYCWYRSLHCGVNWTAAHKHDTVTSTQEGA